MTEHTVPAGTAYRDGTASGSWNFADVYEAIARQIPERPCQINGDRVITWAEFDRRATTLAVDLLAAGLGKQSKVACYLRNGVEYLEAVTAAFKASMVPVNTNYRYGADEITALFDNADVEAVVFDPEFSAIVDDVRNRLPAVRRWYTTGDPASAPAWATPYEHVVSDAARTSRPVTWPRRSGDDLLLLYTGGTTGTPKGVMWRQDDLFALFGGGANTLAGTPPAASIDDLTARLSTMHAPTIVAACPFMHATGWFNSMVAMNAGGTVVSLTGRRFEPDELFAVVERHRATNIAIVGQAFAGPMLEHLDTHPHRHDLTSLKQISSSGVMWSIENKRGLLRHLPHVTLSDSFGSSEAIGLGTSVTSAHSEQPTARFEVGDLNAVFSVDGHRVQPGSDDIGMIAVAGRIPVGYYKDEAKSAATFRVIDGQRWSLPGDFATVNADGTIHLLGRGAVCINTGGEKVFPEEVEEVVKTYPSVRDAVVVGVPDARFGETVCAIVETDGDRLDIDELRAHVNTHLARYKAPRHVVVVDSIARSANGKVDYARLKALATNAIVKPTATA